MTSNKETLDYLQKKNCLLTGIFQNNTIDPHFCTLNFLFSAPCQRYRKIRGQNWLGNQSRRRKTLNSNQLYSVWSCATSCLWQMGWVNTYSRVEFLLQQLSLKNFIYLPLMAVCPHNIHKRLKWISITFCERLSYW